MDSPELITAFEVPPSLARVEVPDREPFRIGLVQQRWYPHPGEPGAAVAEGARLAAAEGRGSSASRSSHSRRTWRSRPGALFPFLDTRRPDAYGALVEGAAVAAR